MTANLHTKPNELFEPLREAARNGNVKLTKQLLDLGVNPILPKDTRPTPILLAVMNRHVEIVRILLESGTDPNHNEGEGLSQSILEGASEIARVFLEFGADPKICNNRGLIAAVTTDNYELAATFILEHGCSAHEAKNYINCGEKTKKWCETYIRHLNLNVTVSEKTQPDVAAKSKI